MAKLTGQFTTPSLDAQNNKTHKPFQHGVAFIFTGATKVVRETDAKGKYSFDLANGEYEVSVYLKGNTEKDRFDMRSGEKFTVTATTKADALEKWLQVIGAGGKDELATYYENLLVQMQRLYEDTKAIRDEMKTNVVGIGPRYVLEGAGGNLRSVMSTITATDDFWRNIQTGEHYFLGPGSIGIPNDKLYYVVSVFSVRSNWGEFLLIAQRVGSSNFYIGRTIRGELEPEWSMLYHSSNTTVDSNGNIKAASPIIKLFNDHIESNDSFKEKPNFEKLGTGVYKISNTLGLAKEGWTHNIPLNSNGRGYFRVRVEHLEDGCIVRVFRVKNVLNPDTFEVEVVDGDPIDIGKDQRWIDLRFHEEPQEAEDEELLTQLDNLDESAH